MSLALELVGREASHLLGKMQKLFKPGIKVTFLARTPGNPEGDFLLTDDDLSEVKAALERSEKRPPSSGGLSQGESPAGEKS